MLVDELALHNTLNINVVYVRKLGQSITCLSLPKRQLCMVHGTDALQSGILQCEQSCKHVETHEATLLERVHNTLHRTGHDPTVP
jgi:hypothetical protein